MSLIGWLALGVIAGLVAHRIADGSRANLSLDLVLGIAGALSGGVMFWNFGGGNFRSFNFYSMVVAGIGAVVALLTYHALFVYPGSPED